MDHNFIDKIINASPEAQAILAILGFLSVGSWAIIGWKLIQVGRAERELKEFLGQFRKARDLEQIQQAGRDKVHSPVQPLVAVAVREVQQGSSQDYLRKTRT